mmetsp:Transcript_38703/g.93275  ORF Transcript_38703/g.93275 Transcript_38703/m.93275 type:complete len:345 (+) Transcript_38703:90-1124(+)
MAEVGTQEGTLQKPFGYFPPTVTALSSPNSPANGDKTIVIYGSSIGTHDYTPVGTVGTTDCKVTQWQSDSSVRCVTAAATTFLAGQNVQLPVSIKVGQAHRLSGYQAGLIESAFNYDFPVPVTFSLNNLEINIIILSGAVLLAGIIIACIHVKYQGRWKAPDVPLPVRYSRTQTFAQSELRSRNNVPMPVADVYYSSSDDGAESSEDVSSSSEEGEGQPAAAVAKRPLVGKRKKKKPVGPGDVHVSVRDGDGDSDDSSTDSEQEDKQKRLGFLHQAAAAAPQQQQQPIVGRNVATGEPVRYTDDREAGARPYGEMSRHLESVPTPIPKTHTDKKKQALKKKDKQ